MPGLKFFLSLFVWALAMALPVYCGAQGGAKVAWDAIPAAAKPTADTADVIVMYSTPDFGKLRDASRHHKVVSPGEPATRADRAAADQADAALTTAVRDAGDTVRRGLDASRYTLRRQFRFVPAMAVRVDAASLARLRAMPAVVSIEPNLPAPLPESGAAAPEVDSVVLDSPSVFTSLIGTQTPWSQGYTGKGWYVAILDTGIRSTHTFFAGKTIVEACFSYLSNCPNSQHTMEGAGAAAHYPSTYYGWDHGTHVAGIAAGRDVGTATGVAKEADIIAANIFSKINDASPWVGSYTSDQIAGMEYVYSLRNSYSIGAVNMSLGDGSYSVYCDSDTRKAAIDNLVAVNIAVSVSSGNSYYTNSLSGPACISSAISVGASDSADVEAGFSNYQPSMLDVFAPGVSVYSSVPDSDVSFASWSGTSMAAPHVAGAWTLLRQRYPTRSVAELLASVQQTGHAVTLKAGDQTGGSVRRIDLSKLIATPVPSAVLELLLN